LSSEAYFHVGHFCAGSWRYVPYELLLLFAPKDLRCGKRTPAGENTVCALCASASTARQRLDDCGITLGLCRRLYEELAQVPLQPFGAYGVDLNAFAAGVPFEEYSEQLFELWRTNRSLLEFLCSERESDAGVRQMAGAAFCSRDDGEGLGPFSEAQTLIFLRTLLEKLPTRTQVELDLTEIVLGYELGPEWATELLTNCRQFLARKIAVEYQLYGFVLKKDPQVSARLRAKIAKMTENAFIDRVLLPLLTKCGFERLQRVTFHGSREFGRDILPFRQRTAFGTYDYLALQAKSTRIHGKSKASGNVSELIRQATAAFSVSFVDGLDNERKRIDKFIVANNQEITPDARRILEDAFEGDRRFHFLDLGTVVDLVCEKDLVAFVLFAETTEAT